MSTQQQKNGVVVVILAGGATRGTRFGPLEIPKYLFPIGSRPLIGHHLLACEDISKSEDFNLNEVFLIGFEEKKTAHLWDDFLNSVKRNYDIPEITFLKETGEQRLGTGGGLEFFRKHIFRSDPHYVILLHGDVFCQFPLLPLLQSHHSHHSATGTMMVVSLKDTNSLSHYGCVVLDPETQEILHFAEKPETYISRMINGGAYCFSKKFFDLLDEVSEKKKRSRLDFSPEHLQLEQEVIGPRVGKNSQFFGFDFSTNSSDFWSQVKDPADALFCTREFLSRTPERPDPASPHLVTPVYIHPSAQVHKSAQVGPNVVVMAGCKIGAGVRVRDAILMEDVELDAHCCVLNAVVGWKSRIGRWARIEGGDSSSSEGTQQRNAQPKDGNAVTVLGHQVKVWPEVIIRSCITLHNRDFTTDQYNDILL